MPALWIASSCPIEAKPAMLNPQSRIFASAGASPGAMSQAMMGNSSADLFVVGSAAPADAATQHNTMTASAQVVGFDVFIPLHTGRTSNAFIPALHVHPFARRQRRGNNHVERSISNGQVRKESGRQGEKGDARAQARDAQERPLGQEGQEPQAGDRNRPVPGAQGGGEGAEEAVVLVAKAVVEEVLKPRFGMAPVTPAG